MTSYTSRMLKVALLAALALTGAATGALPLASAAECTASVGGEEGVYVYCRSNGPGTCGAAAFASASGSSGAGCVVADYPQDPEEDP